MIPRAKKIFGQNFLVDQTVVTKIIQAADIQKGETVLEIGPGTGVLTRALESAGARVIAIEADGDLISGLEKEFGEKITLIHGDVLSTSYLPLATSPYKLIANIPYNITSAVIQHFLTTSPRPSQMILMLQREVADRITAVPPDMSLLSVVCQLYASCHRVTTVKAGAFRPIPKVDSAVVKFDLYDARHPSLAGQHPEHVISLAKRGFSAKRKQLKTNLGPRAVVALKELDLDPKIRAENLTLEQWIRLSINMSSHQLKKSVVRV